MTIKKFFPKLLFLAPIFLLVVGTNYWVDPAQLFRRGKYEQGIANLLLQGKNVANISNYDDRLVQKFYISGLEEGKDIVVFGSSHSMVFHADLFPGYTFYNASVSGASLEDHLAIWELYRQRGLNFSVIVIELDPWLLNINNEQSHWMALRDEYHAARQRLGFPALENVNPLSTFSLARYLELISPSYFQESFRVWKASLLSGLPMSGRYYATDETVADTSIKLADGSLSYSLQARRLDVYVPNALTTLKNFTQLDPDLMSQLEAWADALQNDGAQVIFVLSPYQVQAYDFLINSPEYRIILDAQAYYEELAAEKHIPLLGSYNPTDIPCDPTAFYDEQHPDETCVEQIFAGLPSLDATPLP